MKTVLITGASQGLGRALARLLAARGYRLVLNARNAERLQEVAWELGATAVAGDVSEVAEELAAAAGRVDVLINNASELGPLPMPQLEDYPWDALLRVFKVNAVAPLHLAQLVLPQMKERGEGLILNISSDAATNAYPGWGGYGASKAALEHISRTLAVELEGTGVRVEVVDPGEMATQMHRDAINGGDVSHLPPPESVAPRIVARIEDALGEAA
ncbi:MAG TPA: SDR family NAD(P)-dependent oxidoreductase [Thermoanaerobaculia bacterium]|nr:SDR family NAD(P)-dependent oxidoreductase [Thermoanaerobaculia bacterium]